MHFNEPLFSPEPSSAGEYVMVVLALLNNFHKTLKEKQSQCLNKVHWGEPVLPGQHASFTIDYKPHHGTLSTDSNAAQSHDDEDESTKEGRQVAENTTNQNSNAVVHLEENHQKEKSEATNLIYGGEEEETLNILHPTTPDGNIQKWKNKKLRLCKKSSNKENHKQNGKLRCLQRRSLFRKAHPETASVPSIAEIPELNADQMQVSLSLSTTAVKEINTTATPVSLGPSKFPEDKVNPADPLSVDLVSKESLQKNKTFSLQTTPNSSPLKESNPSNSLSEVRSNSPVFSAYESPFRNSDLVSHSADNAIANFEESVPNGEVTDGETPCKCDPNLTEPDRQDVICSRQKKRQKTTNCKKLPKQRRMVQCPLCCEWFKPKVIEVHAANCGLTTPVQNDNAQENLDALSVSCENEVQRESCVLNCPSQPENFKTDLTRDMSTCKMLETVNTVLNLDCPLAEGCKVSEEPNSPSLYVAELELVKESVMTFENDKKEQMQQQQQQITEPDCVPTKHLAEHSDLLPILKRCFICDLSYVEGKPFLNHLRMCRKKYQKLKRQFTGFSEESEEPQRKTRSHSILPNS